jgi:hypothetical protein
MPREGCATDVKQRNGDILDGPCNEWLQWTVGQLRGRELAGCMAPPHGKNLASEIPRIDYSIAIKLVPRPETSQNIASVREWLALHTGLPRPTSTDFHITLVYLLRTTSEEERIELTALVQGHMLEASREIVFPVVDLCSFENLQVFTPHHVFHGM